MPHFLVKKEEIKSDYIELIDSDTFSHIVKVRRAKVGENITFIDSNHILYRCKIKQIEKKSLVAESISKEISNRILKYNISLVQSILAPDAQNLLIANATQTGVKKIYPVISDNVSSKVSSEKIVKWQKIVFENFKQCERADMAEVQEIKHLKEILNNFKKENILIFSEKDINISLNNSIKDVDKTSEIAIAIGPEGGFSENEFKFFKDENYKMISLGNMIYKAPNAAVAAVSNVVSRLENNE